MYLICFYKKKILEINISFLIKAQKKYYNTLNFKFDNSLTA